MNVKHCNGCRDDFYNGRNQLGVKQCWGLKTAKLVTRYRIGTWTPPTEPFAFTEVRVPSCFHQSGSSFYSSLPSFVSLKNVIRRGRSAARRAPGDGR